MPLILDDSCRCIWFSGSTRRSGWARRKSLAGMCTGPILVNIGEGRIDYALAALCRRP